MPWEKFKLERRHRRSPRQTETFGVSSESGSVDIFFGNKSAEKSPTCFYVGLAIEAVSNQGLPAVGNGQAACGFRVV